MREYFEKTKVAIIFKNNQEHRIILEYFGLKNRRSLSFYGACSIFRYKTRTGLIVTYTDFPDAHIYYYHRYTFITFKEFMEIVNEREILIMK